MRTHMEIPKHVREHRRVIDELTNEPSDCAVAIIEAAYVERRLKEAISSQLLADLVNAQVQVEPHDGRGRNYRPHSGLGAYPNYSSLPGLCLYLYAIECIQPRSVAAPRI